MMKKVLLVSFLFLAVSKSFAQPTILGNPTTGFQQFGSATTQTRINGILYPVYGIMNAVYPDTAAANATYVDLVPGFQIWTSSDGKFLIRNNTATKWLEISTGGSGGTPTWQEVLTAGTTAAGRTVLTGTNNISGVQTSRLNIDSLRRAVISAKRTGTDSSFAELTLGNLVGTSSDQASLYAGDRTYKTGVRSEGSVGALETVDVATSEILCSVEVGFDRQLVFNADSVYISQLPVISSMTNKLVVVWDSALYTSPAGTHYKLSAIPASLIPTIATSVPLSGVTAATGTNSINNGNNPQSWNWNTLGASGAGLTLASTSTAASGNAQELLRVDLGGTNANSGQRTTAAVLENYHAGTTSTNVGAQIIATNGTTNIAGEFIATLGTNNYAIIVPASSGSVGIGTSTPDSLLTVDQGIWGKRGVRFSGLPTGIPASAKRILMAADGTLYAADTTAGGASGLTVGTTTITSGTNTNILYNNAGVLGEYTVTGTGTTAVLSTSPTFTTAVTSPIVYGGSAVGSTLTLQSTSANGTDATEGIVFQDGSVKFGAILNSGQWGIGTGTTASATYGLTVRQPNDGATDIALRLLANNGTTAMTLGYAKISRLGQFILESTATGFTVAAPSGTGMAIGTSTGTTPTSTLDVRGSFQLAYVAKTADYTATATDNTIKVTTSGVTITLPTAVGIQGREYVIVNASSGNITVATTSSQNIGNFNVATTLTIPSDGSFCLASDNAGWMVKYKF